eukprot:TRINITY_DN4398_c0_g1_i9.p1 TRINITY_DN4398_c0_g1~~TRINITY_DN4398_c0_g1_i9.p1  ORF type:complete len:323 (+),score=37.83 TRINITY_DN4398_c0_g1_i9:73-1041(+)
MFPTLLGRTVEMDTTLSVQGLKKRCISGLQDGKTAETDRPPAVASEAALQEPSQSKVYELKCHLYSDSNNEAGRWNRQVSEKSLASVLDDSDDSDCGPDADCDGEAVRWAPFDADAPYTSLPPYPRLPLLSVSGGKAKSASCPSASRLEEDDDSFSDWPDADCNDVRLCAGTPLMQMLHTHPCHHILECLGRPCLATMQSRLLVHQPLAWRRIMTPSLIADLILTTMECLPGTSWSRLLAHQSLCRKIVMTPLFTPRSLWSLLEDSCDSDSGPEALRCKTLMSSSLITVLMRRRSACLCNRRCLIVHFWTIPFSCYVSSSHH